MKIEKTTNICAKTTNGVEINVGDSLLFTAEGKGNGKILNQTNS